MTGFARLRSFLRALLFPRRLSREIADDLRLHLAERTDDLIAQGLPPLQAQATARRELGDPVKWVEEGREARGTRYVDELNSDVRYALRWLRRSPAITATAVLSLAIGIGANAAIFNLLDVVLLRSLPVRNPHELVAFSMSTPRGEPMRAFSYRMFRGMERGSDSVVGMLAVSFTRLSVQAEQVSYPTARGQMASGSYYEVLGIPAIVGRTLLPGDDGAPGTGAVAVLSHGYWSRAFGQDPSVVGRTIALNGLPFTIVGVSAPGFFGTQVGDSADVTVPLSMEPALMVEPSGGRLRAADGDLWLEVMGRRRPDVDHTHARAELQARFQPLVDDMIRSAGPKAKMMGARVLEIESGGRGVSVLRQRFSRPLLLLMGAVLLVLTISCANVANLLLARASARQREMAVRVSLGAGRWRLVRQLMTESILLALLGGALGLLLAIWSSRSLAALLVDGRDLELAARPDARVFAFTFAVSLLTGIVFGLVPALRTSHLDTNAALKDSGRGFAAGGRRFGLRGSLVALQVAISVVLLVSAALFVRTLMNLRQLDLGMDQEHVLTLRLEPTGSNQKRDNETRLRQIYGQVLSRVKDVPGVRAASLSGSTPLSAEYAIGAPIEVDGYVPQPGEDMRMAMMQVYPGYFDALGVPLLAGRDLQASDDRPAAPIRAVINEVMARRFFRDPASAIGRTFTLPNGRPRPVVEIVGVSGDVRDRAIRESTQPLAYTTYAKTPTGRGQMTLIVRAAGNPHSLMSAIRQLAREADPTMPLLEVETLADRVAVATRQESLVALLSTVFGGMAVLLAAVGLYGVLAYAVTRRQIEFGVRLALGATPSGLERLVLGDSLLLVGIGLAIGLVVAGAVSRSLSRMLFGLTTFDPASFAAASALLLGVALVASWLPARHAARVDPIVALRQE
jgi:predicted permease